MEPGGSPNLYTSTMQVLEGEEELDREETSFGIRTLSIDAAHGVRINGQTVKLRGACIHHDNGILGAATLPDAEERRIRQLKNRLQRHPLPPITRQGGRCWMPATGTVCW